MKKRILFTVLLVVACVFFVFAANHNTIDLPFTADDVAAIELYHFTVPASAEKRTVTDQADIQAIVKKLTTIPVKPDKLEMVSGGTTTSFRFRLRDDTAVEIIYSTNAGRSGSIASSYLFDYQTTANVGQLWTDYGENQQWVGQEELPSYER